MSDTKIRLTLYIPSAKMVSKEASLENAIDNCDINKLTVEYADKKGKRKRETLTFLTRKQETVSQAINIVLEAYEYMLDTPTSAKFNKKVKHGKELQRVWDIMPITERLKKHFNLIAEDLGATGYTFEILDD